MLQKNQPDDDDDAQLGVCVCVSSALKERSGLYTLLAIPNRIPDISFFFRCRFLFYFIFLLLVLAPPPDLKHSDVFLTVS